MGDLVVEVKGTLPPTQENITSLIIMFLVPVVYTGRKVQAHCNLSRIGTGPSIIRYNNNVSHLNQSILLFCHKLFLCI